MVSRSDLRIFTMTPLIVKLHSAEGGDGFRRERSTTMKWGGHSGPEARKSYFYYVLKGILMKLTPKGGIIVGGGVIVLRGWVVLNLAKL